MLTGARFGTRDIKRAIAFYDAVTAELGGGRVIDRHGMAGYRGAAPREGEACVGNGSQVMWAAPSRAAVDAAHGRALKLGGSCEGPPGPRGAAENTMYAAYFRDPDGNKIMVMRLGD